jgi:hypothetical protein
LDAKKVGVEHRSKEELLDQDFGRDGLPFGRIVEVAAEE